MSRPKLRALAALAALALTAGGCGELAPQPPKRAPSADAGTDP